MATYTDRWEIFAFTQIMTASISCIASLVVAVRTVSIMDSPYKRITFSVSVADIMQSLSLIVGPFAPPAGASRVARWSVGNQETCVFAGFFFSFGGCLFVMNTAFLSFYYLCKIKRRMTDDTFRTKYEWKAHAFMMFSSLIVNFAGVGLRTINTAVTGTHCINGAAFPTGCRLAPNLDCEEPLSSHALIIFAVTFVIICLSFLLIIACMGSIMWHVTVRNKIFKAMTSIPSTSQPVVSTPAASQPTASIPAPSQQDAVSSDDKANRTDILRRLFSKETTIQALLYTGAFFLCYGPFVIANILIISGVSMSVGTLIFFAFTYAVFYPLNGLFTILIYTRPDVVNLRRGNPEYSWLRAFVMVLKGSDKKDDSSSILQEVEQNQISSLPFGNRIVSSGVEYEGSKIQKHSVRFKSQNQWSHLEGMSQNNSLLSSQMVSSNNSDLSDRSSFHGTDVPLGSGMSGIADSAGLSFND
eukprot:scaffold4983_cov258-Chaetoceros_neogracile.AAC.6